MMSYDEGFLASDELVGLRHFTLDDVEAVTAACQDSDIIRWTTIPSPYTAAHATGFITLQEGWRADGSAFHFAIIDRSNGRLSGSIGLGSIKHPPAQVGYWVAPWARRRRFATHALRLVTTWAFEDLRLDTISLVTKIGNEASERVARNAGYVFSEDVPDYGPENSSDRFTVRRWVQAST
jgi:RimJ/RimL family protein N-acetyltransferase